MRVGIYIRVSTDEQAKEGYSIDAQRRVLNAWAVVKGAEAITEYVDEGFSAKNLNRPAVKRLIDDCRRGMIDTVIVWKLDRLTRNLRDLLMLMEDVFRDFGVEFVSATESIDTSTAAGRLVLNMLGAVAQNERENTSDRVSMVMTELSKNAKHLGGQPLYGYSVTQDGHYAPHPVEAEAVRMIFNLKLRGSSYSDIISALDAAGHKPRSGGSWTRNTLYDMLRNEKYTGVYIYNRAKSAGRDGRRNNRACKSPDEIIRIPGGMPAIISAEQWQAVQSMSGEGKQLGGKNSAKRIYLLSGLVRCGGCSKPMVIANRGRNRDGSYWRAYTCRDKCVKSIEHRKLESCVLDFISAIAGDADVLNQALTIADQLNAYARHDSATDAAAFQRQLSGLQKERTNLLRLAAKSDNPPVSLLDEIRRLDREISASESSLRAAESAALQISKDALISRFHQLSRIQSLDPKEQKAVVRDLIDSVVIYPDRIDIAVTNTAVGGAEALHAALVKFLTFTIKQTYLIQHRMPDRFLVH